MLQRRLIYFSDERDEDTFCLFGCCLKFLGEGGRLFMKEGERPGMWLKAPPELERMEGLGLRQRSSVPQDGPLGLGQKVVAVWRAQPRWVAADLEAQSPRPCALQGGVCLEQRLLRVRGVVVVVGF